MTASLFDPSGLAAMLRRIESLRRDAARAFGTMTAAQMLAHCQQPLRVALGELPLKRMLIGVLFGRMAKKKLLSSTPWKPGMPTAREFLVKEARDFETEKQKLLLLVQRFGEGGPNTITTKPHPFFGPMTPGEWQALQWRHLDHHLRQFGC